jgi:hypothetical protein
MVVGVADDVPAPIKKKTNIQAQSLGTALQELARDRNFQIVYVSENVTSLRTQGAFGDLTPEEALQQLLAGTGLTFRYLDEKTVMIVPDPALRGPKEGQSEPRRGSCAASYSSRWRLASSSNGSPISNRLRLELPTFIFHPTWRPTRHESQSHSASTRADRLHWHNRAGR